MRIETYIIMAEQDVLRILNLEPFEDEATRKLLFGVNHQHPNQDTIRKSLTLLPDELSPMVEIAMTQLRPFMPSEITPEMLAKNNSVIPTMSNIEILYRIIAHAVAAGDMKAAADLVYVVDRAAYRFGASRALLQVMDLILARDPTTPVAPQVVIRKARVMKDDGDLHGAIRVLDATIYKERIWDYKDESQFSNVKAVCVQVKGQIFHNLGLWLDSIDTLVESIVEFNKINDYKGTSSSLILLTKCLKKLTHAEYRTVKQKYPTMFAHDHPYYEAYVQGIESVKFIENLGQTLYIAKSNLAAEECLLMFAVQQPPTTRGYEWFQKLVTEIKQTLSIHENIRNLQSAETYLEFIRAIFLIHLTLYFSPVPQDKVLSKYLEHITIELYRHLCSGISKRKLITTLYHTQHSWTLMNAALGILGLPFIKAEDALRPQAFSFMDIHEAKSTDGFTSCTSADESDADTSMTRPHTYSAKTYHELISDGPATYPPVLRKHRTGISKKNYQRCYVGLPVDATSFTESYDPSLDTSSASIPDPLVNVSIDSVSATAERLEQLHISYEPLNRTGLRSSLKKTATDGTPEKYVSFMSESSLGSLNPSAMSLALSSDCHGDLSTGSLSGPSLGSLSPGASLGSFSEISSVEGHCGSKSDNPSSASDMSSYVDLGATTQDSWCHASHEMGDFSPLVDVTRSTVNTTFEKLNLSDGVKSEDPFELLENFKPPDIDCNIHVSKGVLFSYNPVTGQWNSQNSLAHIGDEVDLGSNRKGNCRDVFEISFLHQDEPLGRYVCKRYREQRPPRYYMQDVICQMMAGYYVTKFNQALKNNTLNIQVQYLPAVHLQLVGSDGYLDDWVNVEPYLHGDFIKLTNNLAFSNKESFEGEELATALSHFSHCESQGILMIVDIQGWMPRDGKGIIYLTDPQFHTREIRRFSPADRQEEGMKLFWTKVHPRCNRLCKSLCLARP